jgi:hypothetical protein
MKCIKLSKLVTALVVATTFGVFGLNKLSAAPNATPNVKILGLAPNNVLVPLESRRTIQVTGVDGNLQGIDFRPATGKLYGVTDTDKIYIINPNTGAATFVQTLSTSFDGGFQSGFDFNPVPDRLRIVGSNDQNLRTNVDTGAVTVDQPLAYASGDPNSGKNPNITANAYTNSRAGATSTQLYAIDYDLDTLVLQDPPNEGNLKTIGSLGINFAPIGGFDIYTDANGTNTAFAVSGANLYTINLSTGAATKVSDRVREDLIGIAATSSSKR